MKQYSCARCRDWCEGKRKGCYFYSIRIALNLWSLTRLHQPSFVGLGCDPVEGKKHPTPCSLHKCPNPRLRKGRNGNAEQPLEYLRCKHHIEGPIRRLRHWLTVSGLGQVLPRKPGEASRFRYALSFLRSKKASVQKNPVYKGPIDAY